MPRCKNQKKKFLSLLNLLALNLVIRIPNLQKKKKKKNDRKTLKKMA